MPATDMGIGGAVALRAHVYSIGSELLLGQLTDTNATFLAQELAALGVDLRQVKQIRDSQADIARELHRSLEEVDLVVFTGGVGPTNDDLTREAIAEAVGETPEIDEELLATVKSFFSARGLDMPERNAKQAWLIPSAESLANPHGTAPGWLVRHNDRVIVAMPGVPREMFPMWREQVVPRIGDWIGASGISNITLKTIGIGESALEELLGDLISLDNPAVATYAKDDGVHIRVTGIGNSQAEADRVRADAEAAVRARVEEYVYGDGQTSLAGALLQLLRQGDLTLAVTDQGAGGRFWALLAAEPTAADSVIGGSMQLCPDGALEDAADACRRITGADIGIAVSVDNSVSPGLLQVAIAAESPAAESTTMRAALPELQRRSAMFAADVMRRYLLGRHPG